MPIAGCQNTDTDNPQLNSRTIAVDAVSNDIDVNCFFLTSTAKVIDVGTLEATRSPRLEKLQLTSCFDVIVTKT